MSRSLQLCADDYGAGAAIDHGILRLAADGRLSEVSCMVNGPRWAEAATDIAHLPQARSGRLRLGLHLDLTEARPLSSALRAAWPQPPSLHALILRAHVGALPLPALADELRAQLDAFEQRVGRAPDHIDGHQHVHHLPGIRAIVLAALAGRPHTRVRDTARVLGPGFAFKRWVIAHSGGQALSAELQRLGRQANTVLLGAYDFREPRYRRLMRRWLARLPERGGLLFCHPADGVADAHDPIAAARQREHDYLASDAFADDLAEADTKLASRPFKTSQLNARSSSGG